MFCAGGGGEGGNLLALFAKGLLTFNGTAADGGVRAKQKAG